MSVPRILLLSNVAPSDPHVGGLYLRPLCDALPQGSLACVVANRQSEYGRTDRAKYEDLVHVRTCVNVAQARPASFRGRLARWLDWRRLQSVTVPDIVAAGVCAGKRHNAGLVWAILHEPAITLAAAEVADRLALPLVATVWDPPEYVIRRYGADRFTLRRIMEAFGKAVSRSRMCGVMSEAMGRDYQKRYGAKTVVMRLGIRDSDRHFPRPKPRRDGEATIGFCGDLYAEDEWQAFLRALVSSGFRVADREIHLRIIGGKALLRSPVPMRAEYLGRRSGDEAIRLLAEADIAYVPYWLDPAYSIAARESFPTKISTALAAGTPVMFHGPSESSVTDLMRQYPIGVSCASHDPSAILKAVSDLLSPGRYTACGQAITAAIASEFSMRVFLQRFANLIGAPEQELLWQTESEVAAGGEGLAS